ATTTRAILAHKDELIEELSDIRQRLFRDFPDYDQLINPRTPSLSQTQRLLQTGEALLSFYSDDKRTVVWAVNGKDKRMASIPLSQSELSQRIKRLRAALDIQIMSLNDIPAFNVKLAHDVYKELFGPVESILAAHPNLIVVPHGSMISLPFGALVTRPMQQPRRARGAPWFSEYRPVPWLAREKSIGLTPSVSTWSTLRTLSAKNLPPRRFIGFGNPKFNDSPENTGVQRGVRIRGNDVQVAQRRVADASKLKDLAPLPETEDELNGIADALGEQYQSTLWTGTEATEARVKQEKLDQSRILVFATHGLLAGELDGDNQPALAMTPPKQASELDDGLLEMDEILGLKLNADWVVLSACNTASADGELSNEGLSGLTRAFFYAGSRALLVSLWSVESVSSQRLTTNLFAASAGDDSLSRAGSLQSARLKLMDEPGYMHKGKEAFAYAHPFLWSPFVLVGDGGSRNQSVPGDVFEAPESAGVSDSESTGGASLLDL
ncbi:MAG: CHAT domain-containing protein, partial [Gammaproteobacteria bacterium]